MMRYSRVRSKNYSCNSLRHKEKGIGPFVMRSLVRLGSTTMTEQVFPKSYNRFPIIEINSIESIQNSRNKLLMKQCFADNDICQANWWNSVESLVQDENISFPILAKRIFGFKGKGMVKIDNQEQLNDFLNKTSETRLKSYFWEIFKNYSREYRLHCTQNECFMAWRKLRKSDSSERWFFNSSNCNWVSESHELFDKPSNWSEIEKNCINAVKAVGLDIGAIDVRVQSSKKDIPKFIVLEVNSAPALGEQGIEVYREKITDLINDKIKKL